MSHGHLGLMMILSGVLLVLVPIGIGVLVAGVVIHDRRKAAKRDGTDGTP
jgi:hypothetical protein